MKKNVKGLSIMGLIFITFLAAIQYVFLSNVPESVSSFSFVFITNLIGIVVLLVTRFRAVFAAKKKTFLRGAFLAALLTGFNFFVLLGSQGMDSVVVSSVVSLYFVFVTPILVVLKRKVNFLSGIASALAVIALLLMFGGDVEALISSGKVTYLIIADVFFAAYVVGVSVLGEGEDSAPLTFSQMLFSALFSFVGWVLESFVGRAAFSIPMNTGFWISALFIGIFIRALYGLVQVAAQKHVSAMSASLIFSTEIIITMLMDPLMCRILGTTHTPVTFFQVVGALLLILATLVVDDTIIEKIGYEGIEEHSITKKIVTNTIVFSLMTLVISTVIGFLAIYMIRDSAVEGSENLGEKASQISSGAMIDELEDSITMQVRDKASLAQDKLEGYARSMSLTAEYAASLYRRPYDYPDRNVEYASEENAGKWTMQLLLENESLDYEKMLPEIMLLGNMEDVFSPIVDSYENITTIYIGTEDGIMVSYDKDSQLAAGEENRYYEYKDASWYKLGKETKECTFTDTYWDRYGRGLTITCVCPVYNDKGRFLGCAAMDILMNDLNNAMVSDGIEDPMVATMLDKDGGIIASGDIDPKSEEVINIFDDNYNGYLKSIGRSILDSDSGVVQTGEGDDAVYVAYAKIELTGWRLCIKSPVATVLKPANMIRESINTNTDQVVAAVTQGVLDAIQRSLLLVAMILVIVTLTTGRISSKITNPIKRLEKDVLDISAGDIEKRTNVDTDDEIGSLARSFNHMTDSLQKYIADLRDVTAREERIASELAVATNIQASMLPMDFDKFSARDGFMIYATMTPAKEVGGDFYDFFLIDDDHLCMVMADVSGKGVPAALFMMASKIILANNAMQGKSPAKILEDANAAICANNKEEMFVTVWLGILEISTGKITAANAGHEYPAIRYADGRFELYKDKHGFVIGGMDGVKYKEYELQLSPGAQLFVYTDGVAEATNAENELFGTGRMIEALNINPGVKPKEVLSNVRSAVDGFVKEVEQFDDLTMLCMEYIGPAKEKEDSADGE